MLNEYIAQVSETIYAPVSRVWEALVTPAIIKKYFFGTDATSTWEPGSPLTFTGEWQGKVYHDKGTVLVNEPGNILKYNYWSSMSGTDDRPENYTEITYEIREHGDKTLVTISQDNIPTEKMKEHSAENWAKVLKNLKGLLEQEYS